MFRFTAVAAAALMAATPVMAQGQTQMTETQRVDPLRPAQALHPDFVAQLQMSLRNQGFSPGPIDGIWGTQTRQAVRDFQNANGISPTGQIGANTLAALGMMEGRAIGQIPPTQRPGQPAQAGQDQTVEGEGQTAEETPSGLPGQKQLRTNGFQPDFDEQSEGPVGQHPLGETDEGTPFPER